MAFVDSDETARCIVSFYREKTPYSDSKTPFRFRGMATDCDFRGQGLASKILLQGLRIASQRGGDFVWCNARTSAIGFYEKLGFQICSEEFVIEGIGSHKVLGKTLA